MSRSDIILPNICQTPRPAAAVVVRLGRPQYIAPLWREAAGDTVQPMLDCHLRPILFIDFYTTLRRNCMETGNAPRRK